ncbi:hypothetical protein Tco_0162487 [Tanacetum coccineum]
MKTKRKLVPKSTDNATAERAGTGNVDLPNVVEDVGGSKRPCIREPNSMLPGGSTLRIQQASAQMLHTTSNTDVSAPEPGTSIGVQQQIQPVSATIRHPNSHRAGHLPTAHTSTNGVVRPHNQSIPLGPPSGYTSLGKRDHSCQHCGAMFWIVTLVHAFQKVPSTLVLKIRIRVCSIQDFDTRHQIGITMMSGSSRLLLLVVFRLGIVVGNYRIVVEKYWYDTFVVEVAIVGREFVNRD